MEKIVTCPHCHQFIEVLELNCKIFRCGIYKTNLQQMDPHMSKTDCERLKENDLIYGCGKPFRVDIQNREYVSTICDYI